MCPAWKQITRSGWVHQVGKEDFLPHTQHKSEKEAKHTSLLTILLMCIIDICLQRCTGMCMVASSRVQHDANFFSNLHHFPLLRESPFNMTGGGGINILKLKA